MLNLRPDAYRLLIRPLLFSLPPETAQRAAETVLRQTLLWRGLSGALRVADDRLSTDLAGLKLGNPVGLAAGYDKNCEFLPSLAALGFGYLTGGTVTRQPALGNPKPRVLRYVKERSLINALGFPSQGLDFAARRLERTRESLSGTPVVVSVSGVTVDDILTCHRRLEPFAEAIEINISSPNTEGLRVFLKPPALSELLGRVSDERTKPLFVKLPPYASKEAAQSPGSEARDQVMGLVGASLKHGVEALTVANTKPAVDSRLAVGSGGLSGKLVFADMLTMVADIKAEVGDRVAINACGGIFSGEDAWQALEAGATTVQLLTGLIYGGPGAVRQINQGLLRIMHKEKAGTV